MIGIRMAGTERTTRRLSDLYWHSDRTIDDITAELGVSRKALYSAVEPLSAGGKCPSCGGRLEYTTRTNRTSQLATCASCGATTRRAEAGNGDIAPSLRTPARQWLPVAPRRVLMLGAAVAIGAMVGLAAAHAVRES